MIANIDTFVFSADFENYDTAIFPLLCLLEERKNEAKAKITDGTMELVYIEIGGYTLEVLPNGTRGYAYILHNDLFEFQFSKYRSKNENMFPVFCRFKSNALWSYGFEGCLNLVNEFFEKIIGLPIKTKVSRADLCCHTDLFEFKIDDIESFKSNCRVQDIKLGDRSVESLNFGSRSTNSVYCRIYNKTREVKSKKNKTWFFEIWDNQGLNIDNVWNIEFQLNRKFFKEYNIDTIDDFCCRIKSIWLYLTTEWLVKVVRSENVRIERCSVNDEWLKISTVFDNFDNVILIKRDKQLSMDAEALVPQIMGCLSSFASKVNQIDLRGTFQFLEFKSKQYYKYKKVSFTEVVSDKRAILAKERIVMKARIDSYVAI